MNAKMTLALASLIAMSGLLQACKDTAANEHAKSVEQLLESDGSGDWTAVKTDDSRISNYAVFKGPDGKYHAFNTGAFQEGQTKAEFLASATVYDNLKKETLASGNWGTPPVGYNDCPVSSTDTSYTCSSYDRDENGVPIITYNYDSFSNYTTAYEITYRDKVSGLVFEVGDSSSKDLEAISASVEMLSTNAMRDQLVSGYGLSESRASEVAALAKSWQNIEKSRAMTGKDLAEFQTKVFGSNLSTLKTAAIKAAKGNSKEYDDLIKKAAQLNDVSPEQAKSILKNFVN